MTVNTGTGNGTIGLNLVDDDSIVDGSGNQLGGSGAGNGNFTGQIYTISKGAPAITAALAPGTNHGGGPNGFVIVRFTNTGAGDATLLTVNTVALKTKQGSGTVTYVSPPLPLNLGTLSVGSFVDVTFNVNVPGTVTRYEIKEVLSFKNFNGTTSFTAAREQLVPNP